MNGEQYVPWDKRARYHFFPTCTVHKNVIIFSHKLFGNVTDVTSLDKSFSCEAFGRKKVIPRYVAGQPWCHTRTWPDAGSGYTATQWPHVWETSKTDLEALKRVDVREMSRCF